jgi:hypothetical protein
MSSPALWSEWWTKVDFQNSELFSKDASLLRFLITDVAVVVDIQSALRHAVQYKASGAFEYKKQWGVSTFWVSSVFQWL